MRIRVHYHGKPILCKSITALLTSHQADLRERLETCDNDLPHSWRCSTLNSTARTE
jgi:hypothetical protein